MSKAYLGIDIGGTGVKVGVFDEKGRLLAAAKRGYTPRTDGAGRAEIPITVIEAGAREAVREAVAAAGAPIRALAVVSQGQTFVSLDASGQPLHPAILWYDSRAGAQAQALKQALAGMPGGPHPGMEAIASAPKILWLREHEPALMARAKRHLLLPDFITFRLTGRPVTDPQTAASTGLTRGGTDYHGPALEAAALPRSSLADIVPSGRMAGTVSAEAAEAWGLAPGTCVAAGTNDQYAGAMGAGLYRPGLLSVATGTCLALVTLTRKDPHPLPAGLWGSDFPIPGLFFVLAYSKTAGVALEWFQRVLAPGVDMRALDAEAAQSPAGSRGVTACPHFDGMLSPSPDSQVRGLFAGLGLHHTRGDLFRSLLESLAFALRENVTHIRSQGFPIEEIRSIGGAARSDFWLQLQADVTGLPVCRPRNTEAATLGAAMLAASGAGDFTGLATSVEALYQPGDRFAPDPALAAPYEESFQRYRSLLKAARLNG
jgi:xylulokinase